MSRFQVGKSPALVAVALAVALAGGTMVRAQDADNTKALRELQRKFRVVRARTTRTDPALAVLREIAEIKDFLAVSYLLELTGDRRQASLHDDILQIIATAYPDDGAVAAEFTGMLQPGHRHRSLARTYLLNRAKAAGNESALLELARGDDTEGRFLVLRALSELSSRRALTLALELAGDRTWKPKPGTPANCATIARAVRHDEGPVAARMLLLLRRDPRFTEADEQAVRDATRLWRNGDLRSYVDLAELADPDAKVRARAARFFGLAGLERARAPLLRLARRTEEPLLVREAAVEALGGLRIARADLARVVAGFARSGDARLRSAAVRALQGLAVRPAVIALAELEGTPAWVAAEQALRNLSGKPNGTDWRKWASGSQCPLPEGA